MPNQNRSFRVARERVLRNVLAPAGFRQGTHVYVRETGGQIHGIEFQPNRRGGGYFVNVAFHYSSLPGLLANRRIAADEFDLLDFLLRNRLQNLLSTPPDEPEYNPGEWEYSDTTERTEELLGKNAHRAIAALDSIATQWAEPAQFLAKVPPAVFAAEADECDDYQRAMDEGRDEPENQRHPVHAAIGKRWMFTHFDLGYALALIAFDGGKNAMASAYIDVAERFVEAKADGAILEELSKVLRESRTTSAGSGVSGKR